jgi:hypothetical protein
MAVEIKKTTVTRTSEESKIVSVTCDLCGFVDKDAHIDYSEGTVWSTRSSYETTNVLVSCSEKSSFPEGGHSDIESFDVCPECFKSKIRPLFPCAPRVVRNDW